jgi:hypothetical protein
VRSDFKKHKKIGKMKVLREDTCEGENKTAKIYLRNHNQSLRLPILKKVRSVENFFIAVLYGF